MSQQTIAAEIRRSLAEDDYGRAETLLPEYARAVTQQCAGMEEVGAARQFIQETIVHVRARRAHMLAQLKDVQVARPYLTPECTPTRLVDCSG